MPDRGTTTRSPSFRRTPASFWTFSSTTRKPRDIPVFVSPAVFDRSASNRARIRMRVSCSSCFFSSLIAPLPHQPESRPRCFTFIYTAGDLHEPEEPHGVANDIFRLRVEHVGHLHQLDVDRRQP